MGRKCSVEDCLSESNRPEDTGVTFHKVPMHSDIRPKWLSLCRIPEDKKSIKIIYVCSRHFLRVDFCNFKGKKYMLRQGVLPSVFPWDKSKLESIKTGKPETEKRIKEELPNEEPSSPVLDESLDTKPKLPKSEKVKEKPIDIKVEADQEIPSTSSNGLINFAINTRIEALDNNNVWYPARIIEQDYEENEVLIHFEKFSSKFDEWICKDSPRLRPIQTSSKKNTIEQYTVGDRCLATWSDSRKFPATVTKVLLNDTYEVLFDDGFVKNLRAHRMCKSSPLFDPILSSKQERREKKRKINIAELFGKRPRLDATEDKSKTPAATSQKPSIDSTSPEESLDFWLPQWDDGKPVGVESTIETVDGPRKSVIVADPRLPEGWAKHLTQKNSSTGKWEVFIVGPENRNFKNKAEIKNYLEETKTMKFSPSMFDFSLHKQRYKKKEPELDSSKLEQSLENNELENAAESTPDEEEGKNYLKIPLVDNSYHCPIEGCGKTYRRENLAQMHVKHYHPEYTKFLDSTPNVADLAYARTVGESLDKSPGVKNITPKQIAKTLRSTPKTLPPPPPPPITPQVEPEIKPQSPIPPKSTPLSTTALKDSEIIKLLNTNKSPDVKKESNDQIRPLPSGLPLNMYPDIKLKDLLVKSEGIPPHDEINIRTLSTTRPPAGIKTLLPVRPENKQQQQNPPELEMNYVHKPKTSFKRKRGFIDTYETPKGNEFHDHSYLPQEPQQNLIITNNNYNNTIIEGGKVIKIVRMKQEEIINCTCGYTEEDGLMIQCDLCLCWQHAFCNNIERESQVPEKYVCLICQNPAKQRTSLKYFHDQDWLKHGVLASTSFHTKDEEVLNKRFVKLKKSHDLSGGLLEVKDFVSTLKVKLKIAEAKNHPKLYLWSRPWDKTLLPEKETPTEDDRKPKEEETSIDEEMKEEEASNNESMLMMMLKESKQEKPETPQAPKIPQPEAAIDSADCRLNLLEHILHSQTLVEERLDNIEKQINELDETLSEESEDYPRTRQTLSMMIRDLTTLQELSQRVTV